MLFTLGLPGFARHQRLQPRPRAIELVQVLLGLSEQQHQLRRGARVGLPARQPGRDHAPQGLAGGGPGLPGRQRLIVASGAVSELPGCFSVTVELGDTIEIETPGGGGFGRA